MDSWPEPGSCPPVMLLEQLADGDSDEGVLEHVSTCTACGEVMRDLQDNNQVNILDSSQVVLHYSFFVQQDWLDRTTLLEDIRASNLPSTLKPGSLRYQLPRVGRTFSQLPRVVTRRLLGD